MNLKTIAIASAVGSLLALGSATASADEGAKDYRGRPGHGVELCAISQ